MRRVLTVVLALLIPARVRPATPEFDILISGGRVLDGAGNPWFYGDIAIRGDTIAAVGRLGGASARLRIDASGRAVSPGFIDIHSHARWGIFEHPAAENYIRQGVTTVIDGNDGDSPIPLRQFLDSLSKMPVTLNFGMFAGQGSIRESVIGGTKRPASAEETRRMRELTRQAMLDGAFGLSTGLFYVPGTYTPTE